MSLQSSLVKPFAGELELLWVTGVIAKCDSTGDRRVFSGSSRLMSDFDDFSEAKRKFSFEIDVTSGCFESDDNFNFWVVSPFAKNHKIFRLKKYITNKMIFKKNHMYLKIFL